MSEFNTHTRPLVNDGEVLNNYFLNGKFVINEIQTGVIIVTSLALFVWLNYHKSTISVIIIETGPVSVC